LCEENNAEYNTINMIGITGILPEVIIKLKIYCRTSDNISEDR